VTKQFASDAIRVIPPLFAETNLGTIQEESSTLATSTPFHKNTQFKRSLPNYRAFESFASSVSSSFLFRLFFISKIRHFRTTAQSSKDRLQQLNLKRHEIDKKNSHPKTGWIHFMGQQCRLLLR
jgi:hypothetical protein